MNMEKMSSIDRVAGSMSEEERSQMLEKNAESFQDQQRDFYEGRERQKTPDELEIVSMANELTNGLRRRYGLDDFDVSADNVYVITREAWETSGNNTSSGGYSQKIKPWSLKKGHQTLLFSKKPYMRWFISNHIMQFKR